MQYMMLSEMMKGNSNNNMSAMLPLVMMNGNMNLFDGMFDFEEIEENETEDNDTKEEE